jgi:hypothetical protein
MESYYDLRSPDQVERVDADGSRTPLQPVVERWVGTTMTWGYAGSEPNTTANALLGDAASLKGGRSFTLFYKEHLFLAIAFVEDVLSLLDDARPARIAVREVHEWLDERAPEVLRQRQATPDDVPVSTAAQAEEFLRGLEGGARSRWLDVYRSVHGEPDIPR